MTLATESMIANGDGRERPAGLGVYYDPLSYAAYDHPYEVYRQLRDQAPVYYNARRDLYVASLRAYGLAGQRHRLRRLAEDLLDALTTWVIRAVGSYATILAGWSTYLMVAQSGELRPHGAKVGAFDITNTQLNSVVTRR